MEVTIQWFGKWQLFHVTGAESLDEFLQKLEIAINKIQSTRLDDKGFYMLLSGQPDGGTEYQLNELLYIGETIDTIRSRISEKSGHESAYECIINRAEGYYLYLGVGVIQEEDLKSGDDALYKEIECCLIFHNQPECNELCKDGYNTDNNRNLSITNTGTYPPLHQGPEYCGKK